MLRDAAILLLAFIVLGFVLRYVYFMGVEDGYWEHEAEENVYVCEVMI
jgi:hypothetical protein